MSVKRRRHSPGFKFKVALEAAKEQKTISQLSSKLSLHPAQISDWKKQLLEKGETVFQPNGPSNGKHKLQIVQESELYEQTCPRVRGDRSSQNGVGMDKKSLPPLGLVIK